MLKVSDFQSLKAHIESVGVRRGHNIVVHSKMISFGQIIGDDPCDVIYNALRAVVGPDATIAVPTYVMGSGDVYNPASTPSTRVGAFSEYIRQRPEAIRSLSPVHNHAAVGPLAHVLTETPPTASLGPESDFIRFLDNGFHLLLLGCLPSEGCTYLHHLEAEVGVPYRSWVVSPKRLQRSPDGPVEEIDFRYFAIKEENIEESFDVILPPLMASGTTQKKAAVFGNSFYLTLNDLDKVAREMLQADPYAFVSPIRKETESS